MKISQQKQFKIEQKQLKVKDGKSYMERDLLMEIGMFSKMKSKLNFR